MKLAERKNIRQIRNTASRREKKSNKKRKSSGTKLTLVIISAGSWMSGIGALVPAFSSVTLQVKALHHWPGSRNGTGRG